MIKTLDEFEEKTDSNGPPEEKSPEVLPSLKEMRMGKGKRLKVRWNLQAGALVDEMGNPISNTILAKAYDFIEYKHIEMVSDEPIEGTAFRVRTYSCLGSNRTIYTVKVCVFAPRVNLIKVGCNCQFGSYNRLCSHALAVLISEGLGNKERLVSGINDIKPRRL